MNISKRIIRNSSVFVSTFMFFSVSMYAFEPLPISEAVNKALSYSPALQSYHLQREVTGEKENQARSMKRPKVNISLEESLNDSPLMAFGAKLNQGRIRMEDFVPESLNDPDGINNLRLSTKIMFPLCLGGMDKNALGAAVEAGKVSEYEKSRFREQVIFQTIETYLSTILARENVLVAEKALDASAESVRNAKEMFEAQRAVESDYLQANVHHLNNEENLLRAQNQHRLMLETLATIMGTASATDYDLTLPFVEQKCESCGEEPESLLEKALSKRSDYLKLFTQEKALKKEEKMHRGSTRPHLFAGAMVEHNRNDTSNAGKSHSMIFAKADWNISDGGESISKARASARQASAIEKMREAQKDMIHLELRRAITNINNSLERIRVSEKAVEQSRESLRIQRDRYNAGLSIMSDLLNAETSLLSHQKNHLQALYDHAISKANLKMALGELTPESCQILETH